MTEPTSTTPVNDTRLLVAKVTLLASAMLTVMAGATIAPALPGIEHHFVAELGKEATATLPLGLGSLTIPQFKDYMLTLPGLTVAIFAPLSGLIGDRTGRVKVLTFSILLYVLAGSAGLVLDDMLELLASRALLGVAVGGIMTSATALVADLFIGKARQKFLGLQGAFMSFGGVAFVTLGGALSDMSWRAPFFVYAIPVLMLPGIWIGLRGCRGKGGVDTGEVFPAGLPWGQIALLYATGFCVMASFYIVPTQLPSVLQSAPWAVSGLVTGLILGSVSAIGGTMGLNFGRLRRVFSNPGIMLLNLGLTGLGLLIIGLGQMTSSVAWLALGLLCIGLGSGLGMANLTEWLSGIVPPHVRGRVLGGLTTSIFIGSFASPKFVRPLIDTYGQDVAWIVAGIAVMILTAIAVPVGYRMRKRHEVRQTAMLLPPVPTPPIA